MEDAPALICERSGQPCEVERASRETAGQVDGIGPTENKSPIRATAQKCARTELMVGNTVGK